MKLSPESADNMTTYKFGTGVASHMFCKRCGVQALYIPRSDPDWYSVNVRCLQWKNEDVKIASFEGINWKVSHRKLEVK